MSTDVEPEAILEHIGICGRYQLFLGITFHLLKLVWCWSIYGMVLATAVPKWYCADVRGDNSNETTSTSVVSSNMSEKSCFVDGHLCSSFKFDSYMTTIVSEWNMVCSLSWVPTMIASLLMAGQLVGCLVSGHIADAAGRKIPLYASVIIMLVFNIVSYFSVSWVMFAVARVGLGIGIGFFSSTQYTLTSEVTLAKWRAVNINVPSFHIHIGLFALVAWAVRDWRNIHLITGLIAVPFIATRWCTQESFRWYMSRDRPRKAVKMIQNIAKFNKRKVPEDIALELLSEHHRLNEENKGDEKGYSVIDLFRSTNIVKITLLLIVDWIAMGMVSNGILFGVQALSGNFFLNLMLLGITSLPSTIVALLLCNTIGRRYAGALSYGICALGSLVVGILQYAETDNKSTLIVIFAFVAFFGIHISWGVVQTMTMELYPTVVRNNGYGFQNTMSRIGAIIGPQIAFLDTNVPGVMYFVIAGLTTLCVISMFFLPETKNAKLADKLGSGRETVTKPKETEEDSKLV